jgi:filamentous hemagglutinin family protein
MNRVYRLLWSQAAGAWIAVAETARRQGKSVCSRRLLAATLLLVGPVAYAGPGGGQIVSGSGSISQAGAVTTIRQSSPTLSLNWKTFNIAPQETVDFLQPSASAIAINRIFDTNGSQILGHLDANGQVYLINANGILFGKGAQVNVAGLVASTLNVSDLAMSGATRSFSGDSTASVVNAGTINASGGGYVALVGNHVSNQGTIVAQMGTVALAAGSAATITFAGNSLLHMQVDQSVVNSVAENGGLIRADGGQVIMTAGAKKSLLASVVNNSGVIQARSVQNQDGTIVLLGGMQAGQVIVGGTLDVSSASGHGGQIVATAEAVSVGDGANVQATGATGGGTIAIGAGWEGGGGIDQATTVYVANTATLNASATARGDGGTISVRSDVENPNSTARVYGTLLAHGGASGGNGGRIETSGRWLDVTGSTVNASAAHGAAGEWLLDPWNVIIAATGTAVSGTAFVPTADSTITASSIDTVLNAGNSITITTGTNTGGSLGDITVNAAIAKTSGATSTLELQAADSIIINQPISNTSTTGALNLTLLADSQNGVHDGVGVIILNNSLTTKGGFIAFGDGTTFSPGGSAAAYEDGGDVYVGGSSPVTLSTAGGAVAVHGQLIIADTGGLSITTTNGNVTVDGLIDSGDSYAFVASANVTWTAAKLAAASGTGANVGDTYLATITSRLENAVAGSAAGYVASWLGAERVVGIGTDAVWRWVTGPEGLENNGQGLEFFTQNGTETGNDNGTDKGGTAIGNSYVNWNPATPEPNNSGGMNLSAAGLSEYVMQFVGTAGQWNDLAPTNALTGYVKETNLPPSALNISAGTGVVTFSQALGSNKPLASINISAQTIALPSPAVLNTIGAQTYTGQVTVGGTNVNLLTVSANNLTTIYGGAVPAPTTTYSGFVNGNTVASLTSAATETLSATAQPVVGSYPITPSGVVDSNYLIVYNPGLLIVNPATLTITASSPSKTYNSANPALTVGYSGFEYSDTVASLTTAATETTTAVAGSNVGTYPTTAAGAVASANYTIAYVAGTLTVNPITLTVSGLAGTGRAYNGTLVDALSGTGTLAGLVPGQTLTLGNTNATLGADNAGSEPITSAITLGDGTGGGLAANYVLTQPTLSNVTITPATLTISGYSGTGRAYNASTTDALSGAGTLSGLVNGDTLTLGGNTIGTLASANAGSEAITTAITLANGTGLASNYTLTQPTLPNVTITQAPLTVSGFSGSARVYNGSAVDALAGTGTLTGLFGLETLTLVGNTSGTLASSNAGSEAVTTAITLGNGTNGGLAANYVLTQPTLANVSIAPAALTVGGLTGTSRAYNGSLIDALSGTGALAGLIGSETLTLGGTASGTLGGANAGSEAITTAITLGNGTSGGLAANYVLTQPTLANVTIMPAALTVSGLTGTSRAYNGGLIDALSGTGALAGLIGSETLTLGNIRGTLASANVGSEPLTTVITLANGSGLASNYVLTQPTLANVTITPATLTLTGLSGTARVYDGTQVDVLAGAGVLSGLVTGESLTLIGTANGTLASANAGSEAVTTAITLGDGSGGLAANYTLTQPTLANVLIAQAPLTLTGLTGTNRPYNGTTLDALTGTGALAGLVGSQTLALVHASNGTLGAADVGSQSLTTAITLGNGTNGGVAANYVLSQTTLPNVTISPAMLTVSGTTVGNKIYDGGTVATLTGTLSGIFGADAVTLVPAGSFASKDVGTGILVSAADTLSGAKAFDYTLTQPTGLAANITPLPITVSATGANKVYDGGLNDAATLTSAGLIAGDTVIFSDSSAVFGDKNVGNAKPIAISGISASGPQAFDYTVSNTTASTTANITQLGSVAWIGPATGGSWSNPANWAGGAIPDLSNVANVVIPLGDNVIFDSSVAGPVNISQLGSGGLTVDSGTLNVATALNLTNFAQIGGTVGGTGSFTVTNSFTQTAGQIALTGGAVSINQATGNLSFANISAGSAILNSGLGAVMLGNLATTGNLIVAAEGGGVTQSPGATLAVGGTTGLAASNGGVPADISLTNAGNVLVAAVSAIGAQVSITDAVPLILGVVDASGDLLVNSTGGLDLGTSTVGGTLVANSGNGNVTQDGPLSVTGITDIMAGTANIQLNNPANMLVAAISASGANVGLTDALPMTLGTVDASGNLIVNSNGALDLGTSTVGGTLVADSGNGNVTQDGPLSVTGTTDIMAGTGNIQLNNLDNVLVAAISATGANIGLTDSVPMSLGLVDASGNLIVNSNGALDLGTSTVGGMLMASSANGNVTQDGPLSVTGTTDITAGTGNIQLDNAGNALVAAVSASGANVGLTDSLPLTLGAVDASGNLTAASGGALDLGSSTVGGNLVANSINGGVTQDGPLSVNGTADIMAGTGTIQLNNLDNMLVAAISASGANIGLTDGLPMTLGTVDASGNLIVNSNGALNLGTSTVGGTLVASSANGNVSQTGALSVTGTTDITAGTGNIGLTNAGNTLVAAVSAAGGQISLTDAVPLILGTVGAGGNLVANSTGGLDLGNSTIGGNLVANSGNGNVTQDGALSVEGTTDIVAGTGNVQLNNPANILAKTVTTSGQQVSLTNAAPLNLGVVATGGNLLLNSTGGLDLGTSNVGGNLVANSANGNVTQDGPLSVGGATDIVAGTGSIQLINPGNVFQGTLTTSGSNVGVGGEMNAFALDASIDSAVSQLESDGLSTDPGNPPDALNLSPTVSETRDGELVRVTMNIGANGPQLQILNGGMRLPDNSVSVARSGN